jgi:hypothetical protein
MLGNQLFGNVVFEGGQFHGLLFLRMERAIGGAKVGNLSVSINCLGSRHGLNAFDQ